MPKLTSSADVFKNRKLPHTEEQWLSLEGVNEFYLELDGKKVQCALFGPLDEQTNATTGTVYIGGISRDKDRRSQLPVVNKLFGYAAAGAATSSTEPSFGLSFNWPGQGKSEGDIHDATISTRTSFLVELISRFMQRNSLQNVNLVGMSMGSYCVAMAVERLPSAAVRRVSLLSAAAYPLSAHNTSYGPGFKQSIESDWDITSSPSKSVLENLQVPGMIAYFEHDSPPIPLEIQDMYRGVAEFNPMFRGHTILGVGHNFRKPDAPEGSRNVINNKAVLDFGDVLVDFLA